MGNRITYSPTPVTDCEFESAEGNGVKYIAASMQGWRRKQEDRYFCALNFYNNYNFFGVYDGHGGSEVAEFLKQHLHDFIRDQLVLGNDVELSLQLAFLACDSSIVEPFGVEELDLILKEDIPEDHMSKYEAFFFQQPAICQSAKSVAGPSQEIEMQEADELPHNNSSSLQSGILKYLMVDELEESDSEDDDYESEDESSSENSEDDNKAHDNDELEFSIEARDDNEYQDDDEAQDDCKLEPGVQSGSTAAVVIISEKKIYVANVGDTRCVMSLRGRAVDLSIDHTPEIEEEVIRIRNAGDEITSDGRINNGLNLTRAFGDFMYKRRNLSELDQSVICEPYVKSVDIEEGIDFIIVASDGVWNSMSSQEVVDYIHIRSKANDSNLREIARELFHHILAPNTEGDGTGCDNMTCIIIEINTANNKLMPMQQEMEVAESVGEEGSSSQIQNRNQENSPLIPTGGEGDIIQSLPSENQKTNDNVGDNSENFENNSMDKVDESVIDMELIKDNIITTGNVEEKIEKNMSISVNERDGKKSGDNIPNSNIEGTSGKCEKDVSVKQNDDIEEHNVYTGNIEGCTKEFEDISIEEKGENVEVDEMTNNSTEDNHVNFKKVVSTHSVLRESCGDEKVNNINVDNTETNESFDKSIPIHEISESGMSMELDKMTNSSDEDDSEIFDKVVPINNMNVEGNNMNNDNNDTNGNFEKDVSKNVTGNAKEVNYAINNDIGGLLLDLIQPIPEEHLESVINNKEDSPKMCYDDGYRLWLLNQTSQGIFHCETNKILSSSTLEHTENFSDDDKDDDVIFVGYVWNTEKGCEQHTNLASGTCGSEEQGTENLLLDGKLESYEKHENEEGNKCRDEKEYITKSYSDDLLSESKSGSAEQFGNGQEYKHANKDIVLNNECNDGEDINSFVNVCNLDGNEEIDSEPTNVVHMVVQSICNQVEYGEQIPSDHDSGYNQCSFERRKRPLKEDSNAANKKQKN